MSSAANFPIALSQVAGTNTRPPSNQKVSSHSKESTDSSPNKVAKANNKRAERSPSFGNKPTDEASEPAIDQVSVLPPGVEENSTEIPDFASVLGALESAEITVDTEVEGVPQIGIDVTLEGSVDGLVQGGVDMGTQLGSGFTEVPAAPVVPSQVDVVPLTAPTVGSDPVPILVSSSGVDPNLNAIGETAVESNPIPTQLPVSAQPHPFAPVSQVEATTTVQAGPMVPVQQTGEPEVSQVEFVSEEAVVQLVDEVPSTTTSDQSVAVVDNPIVSTTTAVSDSTVTQRPTDDANRVMSRPSRIPIQSVSETTVLDPIATVETQDFPVEVTPDTELSPQNATADQAIKIVPEAPGNPVEINRQPESNGPNDAVQELVGR